MNSPQEKVSKWLELRLFFKGRFSSPLEHPEYVFYFILVIIGFGAIDVWSNWYSEYHKEKFEHFKIISSIFSFAVALIATGSIELMFVENKPVKYPLFLISVGIIVGSGILFLAYNNTKNIYHYWIAIPFALFSLYIWWIANAENANLTKDFFVIQSEKSKMLNESLDDYGN